MAERLSREELNALLERVGKRPHGRVEHQLAVSPERDLLTRLDVEYYEAGIAFEAETERLSHHREDTGFELPPWDQPGNRESAFELRWAHNRAVASEIRDALVRVAMHEPPAPIVVHVEGDER